MVDLLFIRGEVLLMKWKTVHSLIIMPRCLANASAIIYITVNVADLISFKNSRFYKNTNNTAVKDGAAGGGVISLKDAYPEKFIVDNCEFVGNEVDSYGELGNTADGGALYFLCA